MKTNFRQLARQAFLKSLPVMAGYVILGIGFGILLRGAGYGPLWAFAMGLLIYAGSMQYVGVGLIAGGASVITTLLTTLMVNARHLFYSISMITRYRDAGKYKPYLIFALTDETYSLLCDGNVPEGADPHLYHFLVSLFNQCYWVTGSVLGSLLCFDPDAPEVAGSYKANGSADKSRYFAHFAYNPKPWQMWNAYSLKWRDVVFPTVAWIVENGIAKPGELPVPLRKGWWPLCRAAAPLAPWVWRAIKLKRKLFKK